LANRFGVVVRAISDETELPLRHAATRAADLPLCDVTRGVEICSAHAFVDALDRCAR
jgi:hypothetical protein